MRKCSEIPEYSQDNIACQLNISSLNSLLINKISNQCINWNQYYQSCRISNENPFSGSINFDNIGYAWLTIFQVLILIFNFFKIK